MVGVAALAFEEWNRRAVISHLYVDRTERGRGVGSLMLAELRTRAYKLDARCLWVETQNINVPAIRFYEHRGFVFSGLDTTLYDTRQIASEIALFLSMPIGAIHSP